MTGGHEKFTMTKPGLHPLLPPSQLTPAPNISDPFRHWAWPGLGACAWQAALIQVLPMKPASNISETDVFLWLHSQRFLKEGLRFSGILGF